MNMRHHFYCFILALFAGCWFAAGLLSPLHAQMVSVVNSAENDEFAYAWDDTATENIDESIDGICMDEKKRCTLQAALQEASALGQAAYVTFTGAGLGVITVDFLNGQNGFGPPSGSRIKGTNGLPYINGSGPFSFLMALEDNTTIQGLTFSNATEAIDVAGSGNIIGGSAPDERNIFFGMKQAAINLIGDDNVVKGNYIGITSGGTANANQFGVFVTNSSRNVIGGTTPGEANVISGNKQGIALVGDSTESGLTFGHNEIIGNLIGTDPTGTSKIPNEFGITVQFQHALTIGSLVHPGKRNIISGNSVSGISLGANADTTYILGNYIGTDITGVYWLGNQTGIQLGPGSRRSLVVNNLISTNLEGITIAGYEGTPDLLSTGHVISGNTIMLNQLRGISIDYHATDNIIGSSLTQNFTPNIIAYNGTQGALAPSAGITVAGYPGLGIPHGNTIRKNDFVGNTSRGILFDRAVSVQNGMKPPVIRIYTVYGDGTSLVYGTHHRPGSLIDIYSAQGGSSTTFQGRQWLASGYVDGNGEFSVSMDSCTCSRLIAIATDASGNSSEFSRSFATRPGVLSSNLSAGANAVSPSAGPPNSTTNLYPGATSNAYTWVGPTNKPGMVPSSAAGTYVAVDTILPGVGYWIKYDTPATDSISGALYLEDSVTVAAGWNFIGSISDPVPVSEIGSIPGGLVTSQFFGYTSSYNVVDTLFPGQAYWVKVNQGGTLVFASSDGPLSDSLISIVPDAEMPPPPPPEVLGSTTTAQLSLNQGWNMVSVPINALDFHKTVIFPDAISNVFSYTAGQYASEDTLGNGAGYWVKYGSAINQDITGYPLPADTFDVTAGWNLIGSIGDPVPVSQITSTPGGMIASQFFGYDLFYSNADTLIPGKAYWVKVNQAGQLNLSSTVTTSSTRISIVPTEELPPSPPESEIPHPQSAIPREFSLEQNYPNPFNPSTVIRYQLPVDSYVTLRIFNVLGEAVATITNGTEEAGYKSAVWNASAVPSGMYFYKLQAGTFVETKKLLLLK
jgi:hypothetical protein